jgi:putative transport protein
VDWFVELVSEPSIAHSILVLSLAVALGLALGSVKLLGIRLGVGGVLFAGLALGHLGLGLDEQVMAFVREFGLILFVYAIGLQVGPGFFSSLRKHGLSLNATALSVTLLGSLTAVVIGLLAKLDFSVVMGLLAGGVTNTPSLGAAQQAIQDLPQASDETVANVGLAYAVAYPFGIIGEIATQVLHQRHLRHDPAAEVRAMEHAKASEFEPIETRNVQVANPNLDGKSIAELAQLTGPGVVISRMSRGGEQMVATGKSRLAIGDVLHAVGTAKRLDAFVMIVGALSDVEVPKLRGAVSFRRMVVTNKEVVGKHLAELNLIEQFGIVVARVARSGIEFTPQAELRLQFGDRLVVVGPEPSLEQAAARLGDSVKDLETPHIIPIFVGIALGVLVGSIPFSLPHIPAPVKLGLAGGPLLVAIVMGRIGKLGPIISYMPNPAKNLLKEFGIALFLACVGLRGGERFVSILLEGDGLYWMALAALITVLPVLIVGVVLRLWRKTNYITLIGVLAGSMTDPPALAFATQLAGSDAPSVSYATVYPLTMLMRVVLAQIIVLVAMG